MLAGDKIVYLDNNATTQLDPQVIQEMLPFLTTFYGNPSSGYNFGGQVRRALDRARKRVALLLGCQASEIVFTSCGTESNNAAINSALQLDPYRKHIVTTAVEHSAVVRHCQALAKRGCETTFVGVDRDGSIDISELEQAIRPGTAIVSVMWANNETGVLFPVEKIAEICHERGVYFHTDAVQAVGKILIRLSGSAINFLSLSAHKFHGPKGVGALYVKRSSPFQPSIIGGSQENGRRAGTENVASIVGLGKAAECAVRSAEEEQNRVRRMRDRFENGIVESVSGASINGDGATRLPNTSSLSFREIDSNAALLLLDRGGLCCSAGSACKTGSSDGSHVLRAMYSTEDRARRSLRFSFGRFNPDTDVDRAMEIVRRVISRLRDSSGSRRINAPVLQSS